MRSFFKTCYYRLFRNLVVRKGKLKNSVALTFDDGPHAIITPMILEILASKKVKTTFFLTGEACMKSPHIVNEILLQGHEIGNHFMFHEPLHPFGWRRVKTQVDEFQRLIKNISGYECNSIRPPFGKQNIFLLFYSIFLNKKIVLWSKDPRDYQNSSSEDIISYFYNNPIEEGDLILLHDKNMATVNVLDHIITQTKEAGLKFVTVSEIVNS